MKVLFAGGGTAGHLAPCIAVAQTLTADYPGVEIHFAISRRPADLAMLSHRGLQGHPIPGSGMPYGCSPAAVLSLFRLGAGACHALGLLKRLRPDVVLATGGYVSAAVVPAAHILRIPIVLLAADVMPDRTNRLLSRWATLVATVTQSAADSFSITKTVVSGMPVRPEVLAADPAEARASMGISPDATVLLVTGGSQGAQRLNDATVAALPHLLADPDLVVIHLTGTGKLPAPGQLQHLPTERYLVHERLDDMAACFAAADIVVTRAGANAVAEAAAWGRPMIIVPYPHAGGHQRYNAEVYESAGAAVVIEDSLFTGDVLAATIDELTAEPERLGEMGRASLKAGSAEAARRLADILARIAQGKHTDETP